ncbi:MAG: DUF2203 domain-containing protein [Gemmatimonadota bacterium]
MRRRIFTVGEANALLPHLREVLSRIRALKDVVGDRTDQLKILDVIWGRKLTDPENPDHLDFKRHRRAIGGAVEEIERLIREEILALGVRFPQGGLEHGLLDFPTVLDGRWVYLCWRAEEPEILAWHEVDGGFAGRRPLTPEVARRMGEGSGEDDGSGDPPE